MTELDPGGAERALVQLVTRLDRQVWEPIVIALGPDTALSAELAAREITVHCLGAKGPRNFCILFPLIRILREFRPDILQTWLFHANILGRVAGVIARVPIIFSGIRVAEQSARWHWWWERLTRGLISHHVCVSHDVAQFAIKHHHLCESNVSVVPNGVDWERFAHAQPANLTMFGIPTGCRTILGVGRLHHQKGWLNLFSAIEPLLQVDSALHLLILGEGPQRATLETWISERKLNEQIHLPGWRAEVADVMRACELLVLASHWEGMPNVILEAMAAGLPVVATDVTGVAETMPEDQRTFLVKPNDTESLRWGIESLLSDPAAARRLAVALQLHAKKEFTWDESARKWSETALSCLRK